MHLHVEFEKGDGLQTQKVAVFFLRRFIITAVLLKVLRQPISN